MSFGLRSLVVLFSLIAALQAAASDLTLNQALKQAMDSNPEVNAYTAQADAAHSAIRSQYWLDDPKVGLMHENNLNFMEQQMGPMSLWTVSQEVKFPVKYFLLGAAQKARASGADEELQAKKLQIRQRLISAYYGLFSINRIIALLEAQKETLREVARAAESRHATGAVPQQDEMKAHVEQTKIENEIILAQEEHDATEANLRSLIYQDAHLDIQFPKEELRAPKLTGSLENLSKLAEASARRIKVGKSLVDEADTKKSLAYFRYAPDFMLSYRRAFVNSPDNAYAASIEMTIPLWFFAKQTSEVAQASAQAIQAEKRLETTVRSVNADLRSLSSRVRSREKLLQIYQTALIPQAASTLNSSRAAYQAGRTTFLELLDSERSLYETRIAYYRNLAEFADAIGKLEEVVGTSVSDLPFGDSL